uniref:Uncharacterized protein n=1 Tax=Glossina brevipalpis TaxID=37001 RepID=A0A1A9WS18_9MUSC
MIDLVKLTTQNSRLQSKPAAAATGAAAAAGKTAKQIKSGTVSPANSQTSSKRRKITRKRKSNDNPEPVTAVKIKLLSTTTTTTAAATKTTTSNPKGIKSNAFKNNTSVAKLSKDRITKNLKANSDVILKKLKEKETGRRTVFGKNNPIQKKSVTSQRPSPPLTRSRLKEMQAANEAKRTKHRHTNVKNPRY